jgi:hypothetical protein
LLRYLVFVASLLVLAGSRMLFDVFGAISAFLDQSHRAAFYVYHAIFYS